MGAPAVVAVLIRKERELVDHFKQAGAVSLSSARSSSDLGVHERLAWNRLLRRGVILEGAPGTYYLDESTWVAFGQKRRRVALVMIVFFVALAVGLFVAARMVARQ